MNKKLGIFMLLIGLFVVSSFAGGATKSASTEKDDATAFSDENAVSISFFTGKGCPHCARVEPFIAEMEHKYPVRLLKYDIYSNRSYLPLFNAHNSRYGISLEERGIPAVFLSDTYVVGDNHILNNLEKEISKALKKNSSPDQDPKVKELESPDQKVISTVNDLPIATITMAALVDAASPCSVAILVFLIGARGILANRRKRGLTVALSFCVSVFIAYFLFGLGLLTVVQAGGLSSTFSLLVGLVALLAGIFYLKDVFWYGGGGFVMEVPRSLKPLLMRMLKGVTSPLGAFIMGFVVVCFELPCTGGPYLFILGQLANSATRLQAIPVLLYHNLIFVSPLIIVSLLLYSNLFSISKVREWNEKNKRLLRLAGGLAIMALGFQAIPVSLMLEWIQLFLRCFKIIGPPILIITFFYLVKSSAKRENLGGKLVRPKSTIVLLSLLFTTALVVQRPLGHAAIENEPPVANAGPDQTLLLGASVTFDGSGSYDPEGAIISYEWDFSDPFDPTHGNVVNPIHTYSHSDLYVVTLTVTDDAGWESSDTMTVVVEDKIIMLELNSIAGSLFLLDVYKKNGFAPDRRIQPEEGYKAQVISRTEKTLHTFTFGVPDILHYDYAEEDALAGGFVELEETDFSLVIPYFENAAWIKLYYPDGILALTVNIESIPDKGGSNCQTLANNGLSSLLFDIVFVGDNYTTAQLSQFAADVNTTRNTLLSVSPFSNHSSNINIHWVNESRNLGCQYNYSGIPRLIGCNTPAVINLATQCPADEIIVLLNSNKFGGGGYRTPVGLSSYAIAYSGINPPNPSGDRVAVHEFGHSFGSLLDEYNGTTTNPSTPAGPNCDLQPCTRWASLNLTLNCTQGCTYSNWYRGDDAGGDLMKNVSNFQFGPVCTNELNGLLNNYPRSFCNSTTPCQCGDVLIQSRNLTSSDFNKGSCPGTGLEIGVPGITLDCNGIPMFGSSSGDGILNTFDNVTIKNCNVAQFASGIHLLGAHNNTLINNTVSSATLAQGDGIWIETSTRNTIRLNTVSSYNWGIGFDINSDNNQVEGNTLLSCRYGMELHNSSRNTIRNNIVNNNTLYGIYVNNGSRNNVLIRNTVDFNSWHGLFISDPAATNNTVSNCRFCFNNQTPGINFDIFDADSNSGDNNQCNITRNWNDTSATLGCRYRCSLRTSIFINSTLGVNVTLSSGAPITGIIANITNVAAVANLTNAVAPGFAAIALFANVSTKCPPIDWAYIQLYYDEITLAVDESTLMMYYWDPAILNWTLIQNSGVDTAANYVWANVTHLTIFTGIGKLQICQGNLEVRAVKHTVGAGTYPSSTKVPLADLTVKVYDKSSGSCAAQYGISWQKYTDIVANCEPLVTGVTDPSGIVTFSLPAGDYLIIGDDGSDKHLGVSAGDFGCDQTMRKYLQMIVTADGKKIPARYTRMTGSELLIIEPEYVTWTSEQELYPFIFDSIGEWGVAVSVSPPEGFVADHRSLSEEVANEVEILQFTITDVGSRYVPTRVRYKIRHKGRSEVVRSQIGISLTPEFAKAKGLDIARLKAEGVHFSGCDGDDANPATSFGAHEVSVVGYALTVLLSSADLWQMLTTIALMVPVTVGLPYQRRWRLRFRKREQD